MRICLVSNLYPPDVIGGAELMVGHLARGFQRAGHEVTVVTTDRGRGGVAEEDGVRVHRLPTPNLYAPVEAPRRPLGMKPLWHLVDLWNPVGYARLRHLLGERDCDVVHTHNLAGLSPAVWSAARAAGRPVVHTPHDYALTCVRAMRLRRSGRLCTDPCLSCRARARWLRRLSTRVDAVVAPSRFVLDRHLELGFFAGARAEVVPWGIPALPDPVPAERPLPVRFVFLGQLRPHKGIRVLLDAFARLGDSDACLEIAGAGDLADECRAAAGPRIRYHGFVSDEARQALYRSGHVAVLPAIWWEVAPIAITEAIAHGLPVVATRIGGIPELIEDGVTGFLVEPGDVAGLAVRLRALAEDPALIRRLSANCLARAPRLTLAPVIRRLVEIYGEVLR